MSMEREAAKQSGADAPERIAARSISEYRMLENCTGIVAGVSGGADSVCLLRVLLSLRERGDIPDVPVTAVHVHHGLRQEADKDEQYVRALCEEWDVPLRTVRCDAADWAAQNGTGLEEAGRILRMRAFDEAAGKTGASHIALAHHLEDSAETLLFNLCRGSRLAGLSAIRPVRGAVIHPLIEVSRGEIEEYLTVRGIAWRTDESNAENDYTRNILRNQVMPFLRDRINPAAEKHLAAAALDAAAAEAYLAEQTDGFYRACAVSGEAGAPENAGGTEVRLRTDRLAALPPYMRRRVLYRAAADAAGQAKDLGSAHVEALQRQVLSGKNSSVSLPYGLVSECTYGVLRIGRSKTAIPPLAPAEYAVRILDASDLRDRNGRLLTALPAGEAARYTKWFDYDKIAPYVLRTRLPGDRITISPDGRRKRLSRVMIDAKVPPGERDRIILPFSGDEVLWIPGYRISAAALVSEETKRVLEISLSRGGSSG